MLVEGVEEAKYGHIVDIELADGSIRHGQILQVERRQGAGAGLRRHRGHQCQRQLRCGSWASRWNWRCRRISWDGCSAAPGVPKDGGPAILPKKKLNINGNPINPYARDYPNEFIQTGISTIDGLNPLVRGQKLPIFSGAGLPHDEITAQLARQATVRGKGEPFAVVFAAMGITFEAAQFFINDLTNTGAIERAALVHQPGQ